MVTASAAEHWAEVWGRKNPDEVSWFEATPSESIAMIEELGLAADAPMIDVGGGASGLARELLRRGYSEITVADISPVALEKASMALGADAARIDWVPADVRAHDFGRRFALWHDRAVFHFMTDDADHDAYLQTMRRSLAPGGHLVIATFGPDAPPTCSGLPVRRYGAEDLARALAPARLVTSRLADHVTPSGKTQQFLHARFESR